MISTKGFFAWLQGSMGKGDISLNTAKELLDEDIDTQLKSIMEDVRKMRLHQKNYFATRSKVSLEASKTFEKKVDEILEIIYSDQTKLDL